MERLRFCCCRSLWKTIINHIELLAWFWKYNCDWSGTQKTSWFIDCTLFNSTRSNDCLSNLGINVYKIKGRTDFNMKKNNTDVIKNLIWIQVLHLPVAKCLTWNSFLGKLFHACSHQPSKGFASSYFTKRPLAHSYRSALFIKELLKIGIKLSEHLS